MQNKLIDVKFKMGQSLDEGQQKHGELERFVL